MRVLGALVGVAVAVLALPAHAQTSLDGVRTTRHAYDGTLTNPVVATGSFEPGTAPRKLTSPEPVDCHDTSCHRSEVVLRVPHGITTGAFTFRVSPEPLAGAPRGVVDLIAYGVYDATGARVGYWSPSGTPRAINRPEDALDPRPSTAARPIVISRLTPGKYSLFVYNLGGPTSFSATVTWEANKPSRHTP